MSFADRLIPKEEKEGFADLIAAGYSVLVGSSLVSSILPSKYQTAVFESIHKKAPWLEPLSGLEAALKHSDVSSDAEGLAGVLLVVGALVEMIGLPGAGVAAGLAGGFLLADSFARGLLANGGVYGAGGKEVRSPTCVGEGTAKFLHLLLNYTFARGGSANYPGQNRRN